MNGFWPIFKREMLALFVTPLAWVLITTFLMVQGIHVFILVGQYATTTDLGEGGPVQAFFGKTILLADFNEKTLQAAAQDLQGASYMVSTHHVDVSSRKSVRSLVDAR